MRRPAHHLPPAVVGHGNGRQGPDVVSVADPDREGARLMLLPSILWHKGLA